MKPNDEQSRVNYQTIERAVVNFLKRCRFYLALVIITAALLTSLLRALTPFVVQYQFDVERYLSEFLGQKVVIGSMKTGWYWFLPVIQLNDVAIKDGQHSVLDAHQLIVGINLWSSLWHWQIKPGLLYVDQVHFIVRQSGKTWRVEGLSHLQSKGSALTMSDNSQVVAWILSQQKLIFKHLSADIYLKNGTLIPLNQFNLVLVKRFGRYKLKSDLDIGRTRPAFLRVLADLELDPKALTNISGEIYVYAHDVQPGLLEVFLPSHRFQVLDGLLNGRVWLTLTQGALMSIQSRATIQQADILDSQEKKRLRVESLQGNWAWQHQQLGWQFTADQVELTFNGKSWPTNEFKIDYEKPTQTWLIYVHHVLLDSLLEKNVSWLEAMKPFAQAKLHGDLLDTQIHITQARVNYVVSHFSGLAWQRVQHYPSVTNLSGVLYWEPSQGRLSLDGQETMIQLKGKPKIIFQDLNVGLDWKKISEGWRVNLDHLIVRHPDLLASFAGSTFVPDYLFLDSSHVEEGISVIPSWRQEGIRISQLVPILLRAPNSEQNIQLKGALSATNAEFWMQYLPKQYLKPKLDNWLKHGIKHIDRLVAEVLVSGNTHDFPFDKLPPSNPPGVFEINAHVSGLDLVFAPNWPLTRDIEADLHLDKRTLTADVLYAKLQDIRVDEVNLSVNELGLSHETLLVHGKVRTTGVKAMTYLLATPLVNKLPLLKLLSIQGMLDLDLKLEAPLYPENDTILTEGELAFHDNALLVTHRLSQVALDNVTGNLAFNQEGVLNSHLKARMMDSPVAIQIKSNHQPHSATLVLMKGVLPVDQLRQKMPSALLSSLQGSLPFDGMLRINNDLGELEHMQLKSTLEGLEIQLPSPLGKSADRKSPLTLDLEFTQDSALKLQMSYADLRADAIKSSHGDWSITLNEANIAGKIEYQPSQKRLSAQLSKLHLPQEKARSKVEPDSTSMLQVSDLPNVSLQIQNFRYGDWSLGSVDCKASSKASTWIVDDCKITTPFYLIQAQGEWSQTDSVNKTNLDLTMTMTDLAQTLSHWGVTPAVQARHGEIQLSAAWPGGFQDFSLAGMIGQ
ncbi:MAG: hypothetical protein A3F46_05330, partial [Legionellales bacterium RIFCSPHIGHO2_12_FULL_42_9]